MIAFMHLTMTKYQSTQVLVVIESSRGEAKISQIDNKLQEPMNFGTL